MRNNKLNPLKTTLLLTVALTTNTLFADQADIDRVEMAASSLSIETLKKLSNELAGYDAALAHYRLAMSANLQQQSDLAEKALDNSMEELEQLQVEQPDNAEVKALLAQVYGFKIALSPIKGIVYGSKSQQTLNEAEKLAPTNPRVLLVKGIGAVNTPPMFGGSKELALQSFTQSIEAFKDDTYSNYYWGHSEAYTWRGLLYSQQGEQSKAIADWQQALVINPDYGWAKSLLADTSN